MTNSMDKAAKPVKPKGPIRTEAVVPVAIIFLVTFAYGHFFLDNHLRKAIEWTGTYVHGAEVNVNALNLSLFKGTLKIAGIQVTDKEKPKQNIVSIGEMRFGLVWDALLRLKFVVSEATIEDIGAFTPRKSAGWVRPPTPPSEVQGSSAMEKLEANVLNQVESENSKNILGDLAQLAGGADDKALLGQIKDQLQAEKKIAEVKALVKQKEIEWKERLEKLPDSKEFSELSTSAKRLKFDTKDPKGFASDLKELNKLLKDADTKVDSIKEATKSADGDFKNVKAQANLIDDLIKKDIDDLEQRLKIPKLDAASFSKSLFSRMVGQNLAGYQKYIQVAKQYMPPPKDKDAAAEDQIVPRNRGEGKTYHFPKDKAYPPFWVQKVRISSKASEAGFSGDLEGEILDITTNQNLVGRPTSASLKGGFPKQGISGLAVAATFDHRQNPAKQEIVAQVGAYPVADLELQKSSDATLALTSAVGQLSMNGTFQWPNLDLSVRNVFSETKFNVSADKKVVKEVMDSVLASLGPVNVDTTVRGTWTNFKLDIDSNLGKELGAGFSAYFKQKTDALRAKLKEQVEARVGAEKAKLQADLDKLKADVTGKLGAKSEEINKIKEDVKQASNKSSSGKEKAKEDLKKKGKELLKKFKL